MKEIDYQRLSYAMAEFGAKYPNDMIANALCETAERISSIGKPFAAKLTDMDHDIIKFFVKETNYET